MKKGAEFVWSEEEGFPSDEGRALVSASLDGGETLSSTICPLRQVRSGCC